MFKRIHDNTSLRGGVLQGRTVTADEVESLAKLPPVDVLRGQVLGAIIAPLTAIAGLVNAPLQNLYGLIDARIEQLGGEASRLRPRLVIANLKRWTARELDLRREAASASELSEAMGAVPGYKIPEIDWDRTNGRVMTLEWIDGIKISDRAALIAAVAAEMTQEVAAKVAGLKIGKGEALKAVELETARG